MPFTNEGGIAHTVEQVYEQIPGSKIQKMITFPVCWWCYWHAGVSSVLRRASSTDYSRPDLDCG